MKDRKRETFESVTLGHIRGHGVRNLLVYCNSIACNHQTKMKADHLPDETVIRPLGARMVCTRCGHRGADIRPDWTACPGNRWRTSPGLGFEIALPYIPGMSKRASSRSPKQTLYEWRVVRFALDAEHAIIISKIDAAYVYELMAIHAGALSPRLDAQGEMDFCQRA